MYTQLPINLSLKRKIVIEVLEDLLEEKILEVTELQDLVFELKDVQLENETVLIAVKNLIETYRGRV